MARQHDRPIRVVHIDPAGFGDVTVERAVFEAAFPDVIFDSMEVEPEDLATAVGKADVLLAHYKRIDRPALDAIAPSVVVYYATGVDGIDLDLATARGIGVTNVPTYCDHEVADHVLAMALALLRGLPQYDADAGRGGWNWRLVAPRRRFADCTFGFLGFGRKARATAERAMALGCRALAHDPHMSADAVTAAGAEPVDFDTLFRGSDVLSIHVPLTDQTERMVDARALALLPAGAVVVNSARGAVLDEPALVAALDSGQLGGAGLDVLTREPPDPDHPLLGRDDVIVTPHAAWYSVDAEQRVRELGSHYGIAVYRGEACAGLVNPEALARRG